MEVNQNEQIPNATLSAFISQASIEGQYGKVKAIRSVMVF